MSTTSLTTTAVAVVERLLEDDEAVDDTQQDHLEDLESGECAVIRSDGFKTSCSFCGKDLTLEAKRLARHHGASTVDDEDCLAVIKAEMQRQQYWPNIYRVNDHGNVDLLGSDGKVIKSWV